MAARWNNQRLALLVRGRHLPGDRPGEACYEYLDRFIAFRNPIGDDLSSGDSLNTFDPFGHQQRHYRNELQLLNRRVGLKSRQFSSVSD
jgi:hypothetical protein